MSAMMKFLFKTIQLLFVLIVVVGGYAAWWGYQSLEEPLANVPENAVFEVPRGTTFTAVIQELHKRKWIDNTLPAKVYARMNPKALRIKAGEFEIPQGINLIEFVDLLVEGDVVQYSVTLVEGTTFKDYLARLSQTAHLAVKLEGKSNDEIMQLVSGKVQHPEGLFFPDTYQFSKGETDLNILKRAYQRMETVLSEEWKNKSAKLPLSSAYEALILASIVEKETGLASERPDIAGVFIRRLNKKMRLQTDPTVIYGLGDKYKGNITRKHLKTHTPYNTYRINGLPPTPIAMPGREAINAVLHPADGKTLYFVAKGDGSHQFSATIKEHNAAVRKYQWKRSKDYRSSPK